MADGMNDLVENVARACAFVDLHMGDTPEVAKQAVDVAWPQYDEYAKAAIAAVLDAIAEPSDDVIEALCRGWWDHDLGMATDWDETLQWANAGNFLSKELRDAYLVKMRAGYRAMIAALREEIME